MRYILCNTTSDFLLRKSMKTLFMLFSLAFLAVIQGGEESGKKVEPLPCKDRGSKATCSRYMKKGNFTELCKENRRIGRYLCCETCAEKLGVEVNEDGKFKDFGTFTYYEPTCPALEDRAASLLLVQPMIHYNDIPESETAGMPYFKKLAEGQTPTMPPFTSRRTIRTKDAGAPVTVHIYSKSESSKTLTGNVPQIFLAVFKTVSTPTRSSWFETATRNHCELVSMKF
ncbi:Shikimate O-hydroxycinnamoyltransferase [Trichinella pseudospiralis]